MSRFIYPKPTPVSWNFLVIVKELANPTDCHFCGNVIDADAECLVTSDFDGVKLIHAEHFDRVDNGTA
jgi:hypothetical protein